MSILFEPAHVVALLEAARHTSPAVPPVGPSAALDDSEFAEQYALYERARLTEAGDDDHFYGPWFGGSRAQGGHPGRGATPEARRADLASKVGAANVGNPNPTASNAENKGAAPAEGVPESVSLNKGGSESPLAGTALDPRQTHMQHAEGHWEQRKNGGKEWVVDSWNQDRVTSVHEPYYKSVVAGVPTSASPTVYMTGGGPAAGKSKGLLENPKAGIPTKDKAAHIDPDSAKTHIPEYQKGIAGKDATAANTVHEESSSMAKTGVKRALTGGHDVVYDSVGDNGIEKLSTKVEQMRSQGAKAINAEYAFVPIAVAKSRADKRGQETGRFVAHDVIEKAHKDVSRTFQAAVTHQRADGGVGLFNQLRLWSTSGKRPALVATAADGKLVIHNAKAWDAFKAIGSEQ